MSSSIHEKRVEGSANPPAMLALGFALAFVLAGSAGARPPADVQKLEDARLAMRDGDCAHAVEVLATVTPTRKSSTRWLEIAAQAHECAGQLRQAAQLYRHLDRRLPASAERSLRIADLEEGRRSIPAPEAPSQPASLAKSVAWDPDPTPAPPARIDPGPISIQGRWSTAGRPAEDGYFGETYLRRLKLEVERDRANLRGRVFVEPELGSDKYLDGRVQWYEAKARGIVKRDRVDVSGVCVPRIWSLEKAGVVNGEEIPFSGSFVFVGDPESLTYEGDQAIDVPCGIDFGRVFRSSLAARR